jgi:Tfp pilus assembly protein PilF
VAAFERAANCNPDAPEVYLKLLLAYRDLKDAKLAQTLARAESKLQGSSHLLELGQCYEIAGRLDLAEKQFQAAVEAQPGNPRLTNNLAEFRMRQGHFDTAEPLLRGLVDNAKTPADIRTVARRSLAAGIASRGDYAGFRKALELIEQNLQADPDSFEDRRLKARVLANRPEQRAVALRVLDELAKAKSLRPDDQLLRARLADASGEWPAARDLMQSLLVSEPDNPSYLRPYIEGLLRHNNYPEAAALLARLESREPDALATLVLRVRLLKATGNAADAVSLVTGKANGTQAPLAALAQLLEEIGEVAPAEVLYRKLAEQTKKPADALQLARFLGRNNKATEGLQICQTLRTVAPVEDVAFVSVALVRLPSVTTAQRAEVETWLQHEVESRRSTGLLVSLADLRDGQVLAGDPTNLMALNNLACLLVFRGDPGPEAMELVNRAQQVYGPMPELLDTRALAHLARGEAKPAEADLEQAVSLHGSPAKYFHLARARRLDNNNQGARAAWEKAMAAGLTAKDLHPLEKPVYDQMVATIGK